MTQYSRGRVLRWILPVLAVMLLCGGGIVCAHADEATEERLLRKIDELEQRIKGLEAAQSRTVEAAAGAATKADVEAIVDKKMGSGDTLLGMLKEIDMSGYVDTSYTYNTNHPDSGTNTLRTFDTQANSFVLQSAKLAFEKLPEASGGVGFRADLMFGDDAKVLNNATVGYIGDGHFDLEQAYIDIMVPLGKGLDIKGGKFVTLAGAEVIESKDNWNFSRGILFGYAIPFTHTGVRLSYPVSDSLTAYLGVINGWDDVDDNNKGKTIESSLAWSPMDKLSLNLTNYFGPEQSGNNHSNRVLFDFVGTYRPFEKLTLKVNTDYAWEYDLVAPGKAATWAGVAGFARYDLNDKWSLSNRTEYFSDPNGARVSSGVDEDLWGNTTTLEFRPFKNLITRLEYRYDHSTSDIFTVGTKATDHQNTIGFEGIYVF